jgi:hypothetical protein
MTEAITTVQHNDSGMLSVSEIRNRVNVVQRVMGEVMKKGTHFGTVPGCGSRMVLLKPGADILASTFRLVPRFDVQRIEIGAGHVEYSVTCTMYAQDGTVLGSGVGSCSTMDKKYRYRKDDNGNKIENEDIADVYNTVLKMAKKRAHIDATITVTGCSDMFTQDIVEEADEKRPVTMPKARPRNQRQRTRSLWLRASSTMLMCEKAKRTGSRGKNTVCILKDQYSVHSTTTTATLRLTHTATATPSGAAMSRRENTKT